jgi:Thioesterase-like superfamily
VEGDTHEPSEPYFERRDGAVVGRIHASSVWSDQMVGGRPLAALVAWGAERDHGEEGWQPARLTVDMFRPAPMAPLTVTSRRVRDGSQVRACDVFVHHEEKLVSRGSALFLRQGPEPPGAVWAPPAWDAPGPHEVPAAEQRGGRVALGEVRYLSPIGAPTKRRAWLRETRDLVDDEESTAFVKLAGIADFTHPLSNVSDRGLGYINADLTLNLARLPNGDWIGLESVAHVAAQGVAVGGVALYDLRGPIGYVHVCAVADNRMQQGAPA